jgi:hypothetical protein
VRALPFAKSGFVLPYVAIGRGEYSTGLAAKNFGYMAKHPHG